MLGTSRIWRAQRDLSVMSKILSSFFPILDHLYTYQLFEYDSRFLKWFLKNVFRRGLQQKQKLVWTSKAKLLFVLSFFLILFLSFFFSWLLTKTFYLSPVIFLVTCQLSPVFLILSHLLIYPLDHYQKQKILRNARNKKIHLTRLKIVAITGSFGKTSTKDILYTLLWRKFRVVKTPRSFNTPLGISQTILEDVKENTDVLIAEVGAYKTGEIREIAKIIEPDISIITAIAPQHLERFGSIEDIANAKFELVEELNKDKLSIINSNYPILNPLLPKLKSRLILYGGSKQGYRVSNIKITSYGTEFVLATPKGRALVKIPLLGVHHAYNFLAAAIAALELGMSLGELKGRAKLLLPTPHRMEISKKANYTLIDNSFNTNIEASKSSFELLRQTPGDKKIVVTPGLIELGKESELHNRQFAFNAAQVADEIIIVGKNNRQFLLDGLEEAGFPKEKTHVVLKTHQGLVLASQLAGKNSLVLIENDLPDQYF